LFDMPAKESDSRLPRQHFSPETAQSSQYTAPPRIRDCERFHASFALALSTGLSSTNNAFLGNKLTASNISAIFLLFGHDKIRK
jgi:hypothetical protein